MADNIAELGNPPEQPPPPNGPEPPKIPENKSELIVKALSQVDELATDAKRLGTADQSFVEQTQLATGGIRRIAENANPKETGYRQVADAKDTVVATVRSGLSNISQQAEVMGTGLGNPKSDIEILLQQAATESDPIKAFALAHRAMEVFAKATAAVEQKREPQQKTARGINLVAKQNHEYATRLYSRLANEVRQKLDQGVVHDYFVASRHFASVVDEAIRQLSSTDRQFLERNTARKTIFQQVTQQLIQ